MALVTKALTLDVDASPEAALAPPASHVVHESEQLGTRSSVWAGGQEAGRRRRQRSRLPARFRSRRRAARSGRPSVWSCTSLIPLQPLGSPRFVVSLIARCK